MIVQRKWRAIENLLPKGLSDRRTEGMLLRARGMGDKIRGRTQGGVKCHARGHVPSNFWNAPFINAMGWWQSHRRHP